VIQRCIEQALGCGPVFNRRHDISHEKRGRRQRLGSAQAWIIADNMSLRYLCRIPASRPMRRARALLLQAGAHNGPARGGAVDCTVVAFCIEREFARLSPRQGSHRGIGRYMPVSRQGISYSVGGSENQGRQQSSTMLHGGQAGGNWQMGGRAVAHRCWHRTRADQTLTRAANAELSRNHPYTR